VAPPQKVSPVGYEKAGSCACRYGIACKPVVVIGILLLQDINETLTADDVFTKKRVPDFSS